MEIDQSYYESSVKDGFYIPSKMKRSLGATLGVLNEVSNVCKKYDIKWWMDWGSLLGLIRHGGITPWDDDIDISMLREDYDKFLKVAKDELPEGYSVYNLNTVLDFHEYTSYVENSDTLTTDSIFLMKNSGFPYSAGIDIMVIDYISPDIDKEIKEIVVPVDKFADAIGYEMTYNDMPEHQDFIDTLEKASKYHFEKDKPLGRQLRQFCESYIVGIDKKKAKEATCMSAHIMRDDFAAVNPINYYKDLITMPFEFMEIPVPLHYDRMLKKIFGNYMKPYRAGGTHDYPKYHQDEDMCVRKIGRRIIEDYPFNASDIEDYEARSEKAKKLFEDKERKKDVIFLVTKAANWKFMKKEYEKEKSDRANNIYVIAIPYYHKDNTLKSDKKVRYEGKELSLEVEVTGFDQYDFFGKRPDRIYFDTPYDDYDTELLVHPMFYSERLKSFSKELIYISCILTDDYGPDDKKAEVMMRSCINTPGVARADKTIVQSECMRSRYIESLTRWGGEETKAVWEKKIFSGGVTSDDIPEYPGVKDDELGLEWISFLNDENGNRRKVILVYLSISGLIEKPKASAKKIKQIFELFRENTDRVVMYYHPDKNIDLYLNKYEPELYKEYRQVIDRFIEEDYGIYDEGEDDRFMVRLCDAFYGDNGTVMYHCMRAKKPVMAIDYEV
ncbi:MAG: LicD family protein [Lachnospiraceae bacterium]|nr:LicD family protein [Lachnospiraceae bacterium]